ncbi:MAG: hypothetical protein NZ609_03705 [Acidimicrobiales bacterium]|jgi:hypothetical protein|nr:hypothetical protein [Acidimicrobiales bacterium]
MEPASQGPSVGSPLRRFGPLFALLAAAIVVVIIVLAGGSDDDGQQEVSQTTGSNEAADSDEQDVQTSDGNTEEDADPDSENIAPTTTAPRALGTDWGSDTGFRPGVMFFERAQELGLQIDWGERCDTTRGTLAIPSFFAGACAAPYEGWNGGATARGVTEDSIRIVWWLSQDVDPVMAYLTSAIYNDDTTADDEHTIRGLLKYYETYYETYGRSVDLTVMIGSGNILDAAAARADAVKVDEELDPFMVIGGPTLTNAFAEELHARGIPCISCGPGQTPDYYRERPGLAYTLGKGPQQLNMMVAEYIGKRLAGDNAVHAGDSSMHDTERRFGRIWNLASRASVDSNTQFEELLGEYDVEIVESQSYILDPATLQESAGTIIARMKEAGVTSVIFNGDPIAPRDFTNEAAAQDYWPEWIVTGSVLVDTTAFARTYHQEQWSHAFGISNLSARVDRSVASSHFLYEWFHGEPPRANDNIGIIDPAPGLFYAVLQAVGPELTIEGFNEALFVADPTRRALTAPSLSYGDKDRWPESQEPDYHGVDDISEIWWDPTVEGLDEIDRDGRGMWQFTNGGQRYLYGEIPEGPPPAFELDGAVTVYLSPPGSEAAPSYEPLSNR